MSFKSYTITLAVCACIYGGFDYLKAEAHQDIARYNMQAMEGLGVKLATEKMPSPNAKPHISWVEYANSEGW